MADGTRPFRTEQSLAAEAEARQSIAKMLERHGFSAITDTRLASGAAQSQIIDAVDPDKRAAKLLVRLCWIRELGRHEDIAAAQLTSKLKDGNIDVTLARIDRRNQQLGLTHHLIALFDRDAGQFAQAALVPAGALTAIWRRQREAADQLIANGQGGRMQKNPAMNGDSPTIWLQDDRDPRRRAITDVFWTWPGVVNVLTLPLRAGEVDNDDDTLDDLRDNGELGRDAGRKTQELRSGYRRDRAVRGEVLQRANGMCERQGCGESRDFPGFLDVHHIFGVGISDRVWSCVALCPNCHREAHFSQHRDRLNGEFEAYAARFKSKASRALRR